MGTVTVTFDAPQDFQRFGHRDVCRGSIAFSASYATGGDTITPAALGFGSLIDAMMVQTVSGGYVISPDMNPNANSYKIQAYVTGAAATDVLDEVANATDLHTVSFRFAAWGI